MTVLLFHLLEVQLSCSLAYHPQVFSCHSGQVAPISEGRGLAQSTGRGAAVCAGNVMKVFGGCDHAYAVVVGFGIAPSSSVLDLCTTNRGSPEVTMLRSTQYDLKLSIMFCAYKQPIARIFPTREASGPLWLYFIYRLPWLVALLSMCGEAFTQKGLHVLES